MVRRRFVGGDSEADARATVHEWWPNTGLPGELGQEIESRRSSVSASTQEFPPRWGSASRTYSSNRTHLPVVAEQNAEVYRCHGGAGLEFSTPRSK
jgi:hypothetical protein